MNTEQKVIINLISSAIHNSPVKANIDWVSVDWNEIIRYCGSTGITVPVYSAIAANSIPLPEDLNERFHLEALKSAAYSTQQEFCYKNISAAFCAEGIDYLPIKGIVMRELYPQKGMRAMGDIDILIRREQYSQILPLMEKLGFLRGDESDYEYQWVSKNGVHIELHARLISEVHKELFDVFGDGWKYAQKTDKEYEYRFNREDFYVYTFAHFSKHYKKSGVGIRHLVDLWVLRQKWTDLNLEYINRQLDLLHLVRFHENTCKVISVLFDDAPTDSVSEIIIDKVLSGGAFGNIETLDSSNAVRQMQSGKSRFGYLLRCAFPSKTTMAKEYPVLFKRGYLLPAYWVIRLFHVLVKCPYKFRHINEISKKISYQDKNQYLDELKQVGFEMFYGEKL